jgi:D-arabinose 1-dehydrogenase-like Zn-dependent alcohol dehydrogenase
MKTNIMKIGLMMLAVGICAWCADVRAQGTTTTTTATTTTTNGAFTEFIPASETIVVRTETNPAPLRYVVTKQTTIVDEAGVPVAIEKISPGNPLSVQYTGTGDRLVASRIVVQKAPVATERTTTTTTTTRPLTRDEKEAVKEEVEKRKEEIEKAKEKEKERLEELKDKADDEND